MFVTYLNINFDVNISNGISVTTKKLKNILKRLPSVYCTLSRTEPVQNLHIFCVGLLPRIIAGSVCAIFVPTDVDSAYKITPLHIFDIMNSTHYPYNELHIPADSHNRITDRTYVLKTLTCFNAKAPSLGSFQYEGTQTPIHQPGK